jgi:DNA-binding CsgD family transcriptional regulator
VQKHIKNMDDKINIFSVEELIVVASKNTHNQDQDEE